MSHGPQRREDSNRPPSGDRPDDLDDDHTIAADDDILDRIRADLTNRTTSDRSHDPHHDTPDDLDDHTIAADDDVLDRIRADLTNRTAPEDRDQDPVVDARRGHADDHPPTADTPPTPGSEFDGRNEPTGARPVAPPAPGAPAPPPSERWTPPMRLAPATERPTAGGSGARPTRPAWLVPAVAALIVTVIVLVVVLW